MRDDDRTGFSRRGFLAGGALALFSTSARAARREIARLAALPSSDAFPLGVASGDATSSSIVLWTRHAGDGPLRVEVWEEDHPETLRARDVLRADGGFVHVDVVALRPGARHAYAFVEDGPGGARRSAIGRFKTPPPDDVLVDVRFGASCCTHNAHHKRVLERAAGRDDLDFWALLGDTVYCDGARTRADFRQRWHQNLSSAGFRGLRAATSLTATWDDHEITNDWNPETIDPGLLDDARGAFFEHLPLRREPSDPTRIWRRARWGRTLDLFVLDTRSGRIPSTRATPQATYLDRAQMDWLKQGLATSDAVFKVVVNTVPITKWPVAMGVTRYDRWESYDAAREELLSFVDGHDVRGLMFLSGDFHFASLGRLSRRGFGARRYEALIGPSAQMPSPQWALCAPRQFDWATGDNNYGLIDLDPRAGTAKVAWIDVDGRALFEKALPLA